MTTPLPSPSRLRNRSSVVAVCVMLLSIVSVPAFDRKRVFEAAGGQGDRASPAVVAVGVNEVRYGGSRTLPGLQA